MDEQKPTEAATRRTEVTDLLDGMPPCDVEAERQFLSAAMLEPPPWRSAMLRGITADAFHDPFHAWMFRAMRSYPTAEDMDLFDAILAHPAPDWIRRKVAWSIGMLAYSRTGDYIGGDGDHFRAYRDRIKTAARLRKDLDHACEEIARILNEAQDTGLVPHDT